MKEYKILSLFPTMVGLYQPEEDFSILKKYAGKFQQANNTSTTISSNRRVLENYPEIKKIVLQYFKKFCKEALDIYHEDFDISTSWIVKVFPQGYSSIHNHKNCYYSGLIYYDEYDINTGKLHFSSLENKTSFMLIPKNKTINNSDDFEITPLKNGLIFFPSHLMHYVTKHNKRNTRESLAFNIVPTGVDGAEDSTYDTSWFY
jgi:uncharacterized protein (TIGR02466 family)